MNGLKVPRKTMFGDLIAGLVMALVSIPGGLANGLLAGVNPLYGLFSMIAGTSVAALFTRLGDHERKLDQRHSTGHL